MKTSNCIIKGLKFCLRKIRDGFLEYVGVSIFMAIGAYAGTYFGNHNASKEIND